MQLVPKFQSMEFQVAFWKIFGLERIPWVACRCSEIQTNTADGKKKKGDIQSTKLYEQSGWPFVTWQKKIPTWCLM